ncbi:hypothetical protein BASA83_005413 [Batrachochytrium salamandrivorans]|nr:hypothetical protein BASA83_005413 [Batrachochytrium salamandrivorans]
MPRLCHQYNGQPSVQHSQLTTKGLPSLPSTDERLARFPECTIGYGSDREDANRLGQATKEGGFSYSKSSGRTGGSIAQQQRSRKNYLRRMKRSQVGHTVRETINSNSESDSESESDSDNNSNSNSESDSDNNSNNSSNSSSNSDNNSDSDSDTGSDTSNDESVDFDGKMSILQDIRTSHSNGLIASNYSPGDDHHVEMATSVPIETTDSTIYAIACTDMEDLDGGVSLQNDDTQPEERLDSDDSDSDSMGTDNEPQDECIDLSEFILPSSDTNFDAIEIPDEHSILSDFLMLGKPVINSIIRDYLQLPNGLENFISHLTLPDVRDTLYFFGDDDGDVTRDVLLVPRNRANANWTPDEAKRGWTVADMLAGRSFIGELSDVKVDKERIICALVRICEPNARGNFNKAFLGFGRNQGDILAIATGETANRRPLLIQLLRCVVQPEVTDCLMLLMRWGAPEKEKLRKQLFEHLFQIQFADSILDLVMLKEHVNVAIAASEFFVRLYRQCLSMEHSSRMFMTIGGEGERVSRLLDLLLGLLNSDTLGVDVSKGNGVNGGMATTSLIAAWLDVIDCIIVPRKQSLAQTRVFGGVPEVPIPLEPRRGVIYLVRNRFHLFCFDKILTSEALVVSTILKLLGVIQGIITFYSSPDDLDQICASIPWVLLTEWFFGRFKNNNLYQAIYFKLVYHIIHQEHRPSLNALFLAESFPLLDLLLENYDTPSANRGFIRVLLNIVRLHIQQYPQIASSNGTHTRASIVTPDLTVSETPDRKAVSPATPAYQQQLPGYFAILTNSHSAWNEILPRLINDTLANIRRMGRPGASMILPHPLVNPLSTMHIPVHGASAPPEVFSVRFPSIDHSRHDTTPVVPVATVADGASTVIPTQPQISKATDPILDVVTDGSCNTPHSLGTPLLLQVHADRGSDSDAINPTPLTSHFQNTKLSVPTIELPAQDLQKGQSLSHDEERDIQVASSSFETVRDELELGGSALHLKSDPHSQLSMQDSNNGMGVEMELDDIDSDSDSDCTVSESISSDDSYIEDDCGGIDLGSIYAISLGFEAFPVFIRGTLAEQQV